MLIKLKELNKMSNITDLQKAISEAMTALNLVEYEFDYVSTETNELNVEIETLTKELYIANEEIYRLKNEIDENKV